MPPVSFRQIAIAPTAPGYKPELYALDADGAIWQRTDDTWCRLASPEQPSAKPALAAPSKPESPKVVPQA